MAKASLSSQDGFILGQGSASFPQDILVCPQQPLEQSLTLLADPALGSSAETAVCDMDTRLLRTGLGPAARFMQAISQVSDLLIVPNMGLDPL